jgi:thiamine transport system permease protein
VLALVSAGLAPVFWLGLGQGLAQADNYLWRAISFTLVQAFLSTLTSAVLGLGAGLALARRQFFGRHTILRLLALPLALPAIVVVLGLIAVLGAQGPLSGLWPLYGLGGILLAHGFYNAPLIARYTLSVLESVPPEHYRLAAQLGLGDKVHFRLIDGPKLMRSLPSALLLVFLLCAASFTIVLTLGGGPQATTLEVAIYQSLRADFDVARATTLALAQILLCALLSFAVLRMGGMLEAQPQLRLQMRRYDGLSTAAQFMDMTSLLLIGILVIVPLAGLAVSGSKHMALSPTLMSAAMLSLLIAGLSALLATGAAWGLAAWRGRESNKGWPALASQLGLVAPPAVIATGWTILAIAGPGLSPLALPLIILLNALMALPFAYNAIAPAVGAIAGTQDRLCESLGIAGWNRLRHIDVPALKTPLLLGYAMAAVLSLGDLSGVLFFGDGRYVTLPALVYQQMGTYRMEGAMGAALVLAFLSFAVLWLQSCWARFHA